jgi:peptidyl-prolyl cis-trans isomerase B (cyclophilin B)
VHHFYSREPKLTIARTTYTARVVTNCGTIIVSLDGRATPHTVNSFVFLSRKGYFDDTACQRLTTSGNRLIQCGDPTGTGNGGPGYTLPDEGLAHATYPAGTVAIANAGRPHSGGSQFFIVYANAELPPHFTPFGHVTAGLDVIKKVAAAGSTPPGDGAPNQPIVIESFGVTKG